MSAVTDKIRSRGHWQVAIRPDPFNAERVDYAKLEELLASAAVRLRGWPVPFVDYREPPIRAENWIGQDIDAGGVSHYEAWRFFMSGQFSHLRSVSADWREGNERTPTPDGFDAVIEVWEILFYLTEVFELASRLALGPAGSDQVNIEVRLNGLENRGLVVGEWLKRAEFFQPHRSTLPSLERKITLSREELVAEGPELAVEMSREMFLRFGWDADSAFLSDYQRELTEQH
jgi:hypothetical protein